MAPQTNIFAMKYASSLILLFTLLISACAPMGSSIVFEDKTMTNSTPPFSIVFAEKPLKMRGEGPFRDFIFTHDKRVITAGYYRWIEHTTLDYYYSLAGIAANANFKHLGSVHFDDHEWAKVAKYDRQHETLICGYMTRKGNNLVLILISVNDIERSIKVEFENFLKTQQLTNPAKQKIETQFEFLDSMVTIIY